MHPGGWTGPSGSRTIHPASAWCVKPPHRTETARKVEFPKSNGDESQSSGVERLESCCSLLCFDGAERAWRDRGMDPQVLVGEPSTPEDADGICAHKSSWSLPQSHMSC